MSCAAAAFPATRLRFVGNQGDVTYKLHMFELARCRSSKNGFSVSRITKPGKRSRSGWSGLKLDYSAMKNRLATV